jgi:[ribosomal protein S5]-alanine N-acetyltransferase
MTTPDVPSSVPTLIGDNLRLRPPQPTDITDRQRVGRNSEFLRMVGADEPNDAPMTNADAEKWYERLCNQPYTWIIEWQGHAIGNARLHRLDTTNRRARYAIGIFDPTCWGRGLGTEATVLVLGYAFHVLNLHRVDLCVLAYNQRAIRAYTKAGFVQEGIEREGAWIAGRWESDIWMSILEQEYYARYTAPGQLPIK